MIHSFQPLQIWVVLFHSDLKSTEFGPSGFWQKPLRRFSNKRQKSASRLPPAAFGSLSARVKTVLQFTGDPLASSTRGKRTGGGVEKRGRGGVGGENMWETAMINVLSEVDWDWEMESREQGHLWCELLVEQRCKWVRCAQQRNDPVSILLLHSCQTQEHAGCQRKSRNGWDDLENSWDCVTSLQVVGN